MTGQSGAQTSPWILALLCGKESIKTIIVVAEDALVTIAVYFSCCNIT